MAPRCTVPCSRDRSVHEIPVLQQMIQTIGSSSLARSVSRSRDQKGTKEDAMDAADFLRWRKTLRYTQGEAAEALGVSRATIQNWQGGVTRVPTMVALACEVLTRRWKQRPEFGLVALIYADEPMQPMPDNPTRVAFVQCEICAYNEVAIRKVLRLSEIPNFSNPFIIEHHGGLIWTTPEVLRECDRRRKATNKDATDTSGT